MNKDLEQQIKELQDHKEDLLRTISEFEITIKELQDENKGLINNEYQLQYKESIRIDKENKNLKAVIYEIKTEVNSIRDNKESMINIDEILKKGESE